MENISPEQLQARLSTAEKPQLVDVREAWEFEICHIDGSENIPMAELPGRLDSIAEDVELVLICHHGMRSMQVAQYLEGIGYDKVVNLDGGVDAWARTIDPDMQQY